MLSGETAAGKYPVEALKAMATIAEAAESDSSFDCLVHHTRRVRTAACPSALPSATPPAPPPTDIGASAIITASKSGETARLLSRFRPDAQIIGLRAG